MNDHLDPLYGLLIEVLRRSHQGGVAGVNAGVFHVFRHRNGDHHSVTRHRVHIYFLTDVKMLQIR